MWRALYKEESKGRIGCDLCFQTLLVLSRSGHYVVNCASNGVPIVMSLWAPVEQDLHSFFVVVHNKLHSLDEIRFMCFPGASIGDGIV